MIRPEDVGYELEFEENTTIENIKRTHADEVCIWVSGSGPSPSTSENAKYMEKEGPGKTANQVMIIGAKDAVERILRPVRVYIITSIPLGFEKGFKGKGVNSELIQSLLAAVKEKDCQLTEIRFPGGSTDIKKHINEKNPDKTAVQTIEDKQMWFRNHLYQECLIKVTEILKEYNVDEEVIRRVNEIKPTSYER